MKAAGKNHNFGARRKREAAEPEDSGLSNEQSRLGSGREDSTFAPSSVPSEAVVYLSVVKSRYSYFAPEVQARLKAVSIISCWERGYLESVRAEHRGLGESQGTTSWRALWSQNMAASAEIRDTKCRPVWRHSGMPILNDQKTRCRWVGPIRTGWFSLWRTDGTTEFTKISLFSKSTSRLAIQCKPVWSCTRDAFLLQRSVFCPFTHSRNYLCYHRMQRFNIIFSDLYMWFLFHIQLCCFS